MQACGNDPERARLAIARLSERYCGPVRAYLSQSGRTEAEVEALCAQFFQRLGQADSQRSATRGKGVVPRLAVSGAGSVSVRKAGGVRGARSADSASRREFSTER